MGSPLGFNVTPIPGRGARSQPVLDPSPVIPSDLSFGYLSAERKNPVKVPIPDGQRGGDLRVAVRPLSRERSPPYSSFTSCECLAIGSE